MYWATEKITHELKKEVGFLGASLALLTSSLVQPGISSVVKGVNGRRIRRATRGYINNFF